LDACRNNPYAPSFRSGDRGLARVSAAPTGTLLHFATRPGSVAADGAGVNGLYTTQLLRHIDSPSIPVEAMLKRVSEAVEKESRGQQEPWTEGSIRGEFYFRSGDGERAEQAGGAVVPQILSSVERAEEQAWEMASRAGTLAAYNAYLEEYRQGRYAPAARVAKAGLEGQGTGGANGVTMGGPGAAGPLANTASSAPAARPLAGSLSDPLVRQRLTADLTSKGWRVIGTTSNASPDFEPNLVYADLSSANNSGQLKRVWTVTILSDRRAQTERAAAIGVESEYDCARNQVRPIGRATYYDRLIAARQNFTPITSSTPNPIGQGTVAAQVHSLICASSPSATTG
jgi:hypothetical protein